MNDVDDANVIRGHYQSIDEGRRITSGIGELELLRTQEVLRRHLPRPPARIVDVGGGTGVHAAWLVAEGYRVHVVDLVAHHVEQVRAELGRLGVTAEVGDARRLTAEDDQFDAALVLGPMYHLTTRTDRVSALREARRVVHSQGCVAVAAINRFASLFDGLARGFLFDPAFRSIVARDLADGQHRNPTNRAHWFTTAYFHRPDELEEEIEAADLDLLELVGLEGLGGWLGQLADRWDDRDDREAILYAARAVEGEPSFRGLSGHLLAVARKRG